MTVSCPVSVDVAAADAASSGCARWAETRDLRLSQLIWHFLGAWAVFAFPAEHAAHHVEDAEQGHVTGSADSTGTSPLGGFTGRTGVRLPLADRARGSSTLGHDRRSLVCRGLGRVYAPGGCSCAHNSRRCTGPVAVPAITRMPGGVTARTVTLLPDAKAASSTPCATSHTRTIQSVPPETARRPSALMERDWMRYLGDRDRDRIR